MNKVNPVCLKPKKEQVKILKAFFCACYDF